MAATSDREQAMEKVQSSLNAFIQQYKKRDAGKQFDIDVMQRVRVLDATMDGTILLELDIGHEYSNATGALHGGAAALIFDMSTSMAFWPLLPAIRPGMTLQGPPGGVTRALNLSYLRPLTLPATVKIKCEVLQHGRSVSLARGLMISTDGNKTYATCDHHKIQVAGVPSAIARPCKL